MERERPISRAAAVSVTPGFLRIHRTAALQLFAHALTGAEALLRHLLESKIYVIVTHGDDFGMVPRSGGEVWRLNAGPGADSNARFSPDGAQIAFAGNYGGRADAFAPACAGIPKRSTWRPGTDLAEGGTASPIGISKRSDRRAQPVAAGRVH